jgi:hypothetical protein
MKKMLIAVVLGMCAFAVLAAPNRKPASGGRAKAVPSPSRARIAEIASYLPEDPAAPGARITNRKAWEKLAELESAAKTLARA